MNTLKRTLCLIIAVLTALTFSMCLTGCGSSDDNGALDYAKSKVEEYVNWQTKYNAEFYDEVYAKAYMAALSFSPKKTEEELGTIARYLFVDSITVTDAEGKIISEYPKANMGKNIGDIDKFVKFKSILKWVCPKCNTDIVKDKETGEYAMALGVQRSDDGGCVIVELKTDAYAKVDGSDLAEKCGPNVIIAKDGVIISTNFSDFKEGDKLEDHGVSDSDIKAGSFTIGEEKTNCSAATVDNFTVICAK